MSLMKTNRTTSGAAAIGARVKDSANDAAAQALPVAKRAGTTAAQGVVTGVQGAREWAAPKLEDVANAVDTAVAPKVSSALRSTAAQVRPGSNRTGLRRLLSWRWLLGVGAALAGAGAATAITMKRRYANATAEANDATGPSDAEPVADTGDAGTDAATRAEVNGHVPTQAGN